MFFVLPSLLSVLLSGFSVLCSGGSVLFSGNSALFSGFYVLFYSVLETLCSVILVSAQCFGVSVAFKFLVPFFCVGVFLFCFLAHLSCLSLFCFRTFSF